jgi:cell division protein FtsI (penicillin-binding protein 3)
MKKYVILFVGLFAMIGQIEAHPTTENRRIQELVDSLTRREMSNMGCHRGIVYVVETKTGKLIAHTSLEGSDDHFVPFTDTFYKEDDYLQGAVSYLALLSSGKVTPDTEIDTRNGIYVKPNGEEVRDHNWRRGGYGPISLESVLTHGSVVGYTMAIDSVYGNNMTDYFLKRRDFTAGVPETLMGILTFYNAIANDGCMVKIGNGTASVINEHMAVPEHIRMLQHGLEHCVSEGLFTKAGNEHVGVAACGRTLHITDTKYRLELCGYFPLQHPRYTIRVVLEKENNPASAGGMCGPLFSRIVDGLLSYHE